MKAILLAGGRGERLKPLTNNLPKPMLEVGGRPILLHIIELLKKNGISQFILALCLLPNIITSYFGDGKKFGVRIEYTFENPKSPLGTAGAISLSRKLISNTFIVTYADILRELDVKKMIAFHKRSKAFATINVYRRQSRNAKSMVLINDENRIVKFIERPQTDDLKEDYIWVNGSFYIFEPDIFTLIPDKTKCDFGSDIFPKLLKPKKKFYGYPSDGYFADIGDTEKLELAKKKFNISKAQLL